MTQSPPPGPSPDVWGLQFDMRFGWGFRAKPYHPSAVTSHSSLPVPTGATSNLLSAPMHFPILTFQVNTHNIGTFVFSFH
uniref:HCV-NS5ATP5 binding protein 1 n=1 Tax=Homo sapiens TaxID=9606 RepID=Q6JHZ7_HUMAN|nr:HCV-NS5ATP5 binding protein 1 [Homo sapiens]